jgi:hypothetical protein
LAAVLPDCTCPLRPVQPLLRRDLRRTKCPSGAPSSLISSGNYPPLALRVDRPPSVTAGNLYVSAAKRADGEPATDEDANAYVISTNYQGQHHAKPRHRRLEELGFTPKYERYNGGGTQAQKGPMTEEQKAERKTLIANNKAIESATKIRREFVKTLLAGKQAPKGWQYFAIQRLPTTPKPPATGRPRYLNHE